MIFMKHNDLIASIGEVLWDILPDGSKPGGAPANFAYHITQFGLPSIIVSAIGDDRYGEELINFYDSIGLSHSLTKVGYPTGTVKVRLDKAGIPQYDITRDVAWDHIPFTHTLADIASSAKAVCFGSLAQRSPESRATILRFVRTIAGRDDSFIVFDGNLRQDFYDTETLRESMNLCNILKINDEELTVFSRLFDIDGCDFVAQCTALRALFDLKILIVTCGASGSYVFSAETTSFLPTPKVEVADTVGAGDSFTAAFIASLIKGAAIAQSHQAAVSTSAYVCTQSGAMPALPPEITLL